MTTSITVQTGSTAGRSRRSQQSAPDGSPSGWLRFFVALLIVVALFTWQGIERRPTGSAGGIALNPPPAVEFQKTASTSGDRSLKATSPTAIADRAAIRIGTYNIHSGLGTDRQFDLSRIAALLQTEDFVGLNEVRGGSWLSPTSQAELLAAQLQMPWLFAPTENQWWRGHFGNGALCRWPISEWKRIPLSGTRSAGHRNAVVVTLSHPEKPLSILLTHLDREIDRAAQLKQITTLFLSLPQPAVLLGDLNTPRSDPLLAPLLSASDVEDALAARLTGDPGDRIDWIVSRGLHCSAAGMVEAGPSDHPHFWAEFSWPGAKAEGAALPSGPEG